VSGFGQDDGQSGSERTTRTSEPLHSAKVWAYAICGRTQTKKRLLKPFRAFVHGVAEFADRAERSALIHAKKASVVLMGFPAAM
jgi:hypothetical protein